MTKKFIRLFVALLLFSPVSFADTQEVHFHQLLPNHLGDLITLANATVDDTSKLTQLCNRLASGFEKKPNVKPDACLIQVLRWSEPDPKTKSQAVLYANWYAYERDRVEKNQWNKEDVVSRKRLYGESSVYVFYVHINRIGSTYRPTAPGETKNEYTPDYVVDVTKKLSANIQHLLTAFQSVAGPATQLTGNAAAIRTAMGIDASASDDCEWGGGKLDINFRPSDISIESQTLAPEDRPSTVTKLADAITFDNEGLYYVDLSIAVPVRKFSEVKFSPVNNSFVPVQQDSMNAFIVGDLYIPHTDVKSNSWTKIPHPFGGLAFAKQPLHKILVGAGWGPKFSEFYAGALWVKQPTASNTSCSAPPAGATPVVRYCIEFSFGLNVPISGFVDKLGKPK